MPLPAFPDFLRAIVGAASHLRLINTLKLFWVLVVIGGELVAFFWSLAVCSWPLISLGHQTRKPVQPTHVLLVADAQVKSSHFTAGRSPWVASLRRTLFHLNLRKSWHVTSRLQPDAVIFLGDQLANGKSMLDFEEYELAVQKFRSIFFVDPKTKVYYIPGNNDVGLGMAPTHAQKLRSFYTETFGPLNQDFIIQNHTFVALNAPGLVDEDYLRHGKSVSFKDWTAIPDGPVAFIKDVAEYDPSHVVLLSHIPLSRPETADCGLLRERGTLQRNAGPGFQSMLGKQTSNFLLTNLRPLIIFSADDRDYCDHSHFLPADHSHEGQTIREVTVKSFSLSTHIHKPGFQLLSLVDPAKLAHPDLPSFADQPCFLPDQLKIYTSVYFPLVCVTVLILALLNVRRIFGRGVGLDISAARYPSSSRNVDPKISSPSSTPWSSTWSPYSPLPNASTSPRGSLPTYLRSPRTPQFPENKSVHLVASQPSTPGASFGTSRSFLVPDLAHDEQFMDEDDTPAQYAMMHSDSRRPSEDGWTHVRHPSTKGGNDEEGLPLSSQGYTEFISPPANASRKDSKKWSKSWTFVFRQRRRRITISLPSMSTLYNILELFGYGTKETRALTLGGRSGRRQGWATSLAVDLLSVFWPAVVVWIIINWTII